MKNVFSLVSIIIISSFTSQAQFADSLKVQLLKDWERSKLYTLDYLKIMPLDKYSYRLQDSIRTFAQQMIHLLQATVSLMEAAISYQIPYLMNRQNLESTPSALTKDSVTYFVTLSYDYAAEAIKRFDMAECSKYIERGKFHETILAWMLKAFERQGHHRGQTTIYIRSIGLKPPNERLFENMY